MNPEDVNAEARGNLMMIDFEPEDFDLPSVAQALVTVGAHLRAQLIAIPRPMTFYAWYDEQAGQLRCSVASVEPDDLPFGGRFQLVGSPAPVLALMAADAQPGVVPWEDLTEVTAEENADSDEETRLPFPVFAVRLTRS
ncbi:hypothetical protein HS048_04380 [Planomonospora sp. ID91781]|uniref:hypothetical protein n=1 Tax=Planomonospora sp. ID91781 TaxID=2738135 RepID=UPI0018C39B4E|nr:hypothetical protein [Planomonospora sp. ID91781]MBG0819979.1 hypothetical protein [Planomonospora sp. ID91781]